MHACMDFNLPYDYFQKCKNKKTILKKQLMQLVVLLLCWSKLLVAVGLLHRGESENRK